MMVVLTFGGIVMVMIEMCGGITLLKILLGICPLEANNEAVFVCRPAA